MAIIMMFESAQLLHPIVRSVSTLETSLHVGQKSEDINLIAY